VAFNRTYLGASVNLLVSRGEASYTVLAEYLYVAQFGEGYGSLMERTDNKLLGISNDKTDADIEAIVRPVLN
jgi:hypothetical protein